MTWIILIGLGLIATCLMWVTAEVCTTLRRHRRWLAKTEAVVEGPDPILMEAMKHLYQGIEHCRKTLGTNCPRLSARTGGVPLAGGV